MSSFLNLIIAMSDVVHDVETIHGLFRLLTTPENLFWNISEPREIENCSLPGITHISGKVSNCC